MIDLAAVRTSFPELSGLSPLADGGQKVVLTAQRGAASVVLKLIEPAEGVADRMRREVDAVAELNSEYIPLIYEHGVRRIGVEERLYLVEQRIDGRTYRACLDKEARRPVAEVLHIAANLLRACADFASAGLVHRDIKPENLMIDQSGKLWVIDFGIVRFLNRTSLTHSGRRYGLFTPGYGAPEQLRNLKSSIDVRADLFSTGVVLYEALSGSNPYWAGARDPMEVIRRMEHTDLPSLATVAPDSDAELSQFLSALTARFPSRRPQSAREALDWFAPIHRRLAGG